MNPTDHGEQALSAEGSGGLTVECQIHFQKGRRGRKLMRKTVSLPVCDHPAGIVPRISRLMALAMRVDELVRIGQIRDYADLARLGHVSRARVTQIMNLLNLAPHIQEEVLFLPGTSAGSDAVSERDLRPIVSEVGWKKQRLMWEGIRRIFPSNDLTTSGATIEDCITNATVHVARTAAR